MLTLWILLRYCQEYKPARCPVPSTPYPHRLPRSAESQALLFQPETANSGLQREADRHPSRGTHPPETKNRKKRVIQNLSQTQPQVLTDPSWQSVPKKSPQSQNPAQESRNEDSGSPDDLSFLRLPEVKAITRLSKTSLYAMIRNRSFPAPVRLGPRAVAWLRSEVRQWAMERVQASRSAA
jgi:prophage regulatory protein